MDKEKTYTAFTDFLSDKNFITWKLIPNDESDIYWHDFAQNHPEFAGEMYRAEQYLKSKILNNQILNDADCETLWRRINRNETHAGEKHKLRRILHYVSAACIALGIIAATFYYTNKSNSTNLSETELITGSLLQSENIQLITANNSMSFQSDIQMQIESDGTAKISQGGNNEKTVDIAAGKLNTLIVPYGKRSSLTLADGTKVWLNSGSTLQFPSVFNKNTREVWILGEMYIEVSPDKQKPFFVRTNDFSVQVLGTKFNVSAYGDFTNSVALIEGSVQLKSKTENIVHLSPNQQAILLQTGNFTKEPTDALNAVSWKEGYIVFDETPVSEVLRYIERYYNLSFNYENGANLRRATCKGKLYLSENLDNVMNSIALLSSTSYRREQNTIYITDNPKK